MERFLRSECSHRIILGSEVRDDIVAKGQPQVEVGGVIGHDVDNVEFV